MLERVEQRLYGSRYSCSTGAHGAAASREHREQQLCWSTWSSGSLRADTSAPVEHYGGAHRAALLEHVEQELSSSRCSSGALRSSSFAGAHRSALLEHVEQQLSRSRYRCSHWSTWSSGFPGAHRAAMLERVEQRLSGSCCSICSSGADGAAASLEH